MPDITMCENKDCPLKQSCYRYTAIPSRYQSYANFAPDLLSGKCEDFWPIQRWDKTNKRFIREVKDGEKEVCA